MVISQLDVAVIKVTRNYRGSRNYSKVWERWEVTYYKNSREAVNKILSNVEYAVVNDINLLLLREMVFY